LTAARCSKLKSASNAAVRLGDIVLSEGREANQVGRRIVLPEIRPHSVEAAVIHQIGFLKPRLAVLNARRRHQDSAAGCDEAVGEGRRGLVSQNGGPAQNRKRADGDGQQDPFEHVADGILDRLINPLGCQRHAPVLRPTSQIAGF